MEIFDHRFKNTQLINFALNHPSLGKNKEFQRLEFLGDRIISFEVALLIYAYFKDYNEGEMAILFSSLVSSDTMDKIGRKSIVFYIRCYGKITKNIIADTLEAIIAAIYLDGGDTRSIISKLWQPLLYNKVSDYKTILNNIGGDSCKYSCKLIKKNNKDYFYSSVSLLCFLGVGEGFSKKEASNKAIKDILKKIHNFSKKQSSILVTKE